MTTPRIEQREVTATHCPYCALQCGMNLVRESAAVTVAPRNFPTNKGGLCQKGWTAAELLSSSERLTSPMLRDCPHGQAAACVVGRGATPDRGIDDARPSYRH
jgi:assimilatory nitrate reductase catalytic subunit